MNKPLRGAEAEQVGLEATLREVRKLPALRALGLSTISHASKQLVCAWLVGEMTAADLVGGEIAENDAVAAAEP